MNNRVQILVAAGFSSALIKLFLVYNSIGTNDVFYWWGFANYAGERGFLSLYSSINFYNHPPLMGLWVSWLLALSDGDVWVFSALLRSFSILADLGSLALLYLLARHFYGEKRTLLLSLLFAFSPVLLLFSGLHGNSDSIMMFFVTTSLYLALVRNLQFWSGAALAVGIGVKIIPLIMLPAFLFFLFPRKRLFLFCFGFGLGLVFAFWPVAFEFDAFSRNVLGYRGIASSWGFGRFLPDSGNILLTILVAGIIGVSWAMGQLVRSNPDPLYRGRVFLKSIARIFYSFSFLHPHLVPNTLFGSYYQRLFLA